MTDQLVLGADFPHISEEQWLKAAEKSLKGKSVTRVLSKQTDNDFDLVAYCTKPMVGPLGNVISEARPWDVRQRVVASDAAIANKHILEHLEGGATSIILGDALKGNANLSVDWLNRALEGVHLNMIRLCVDNGPAFYEGVGVLEKTLREMGEVHRSRVHYMADPISLIAAQGALDVSEDELQAMIGHMGVFAAESQVRTQVMNVGTAVFRNAGASEAQELALALASGVYYLRGLESKGMSLLEAARQISFTLTADTHFVLNTSKFRAMRLMWMAVLKACNVHKPLMSLGAETSSRMLSRRDPWVNILRTTVAAFTAGIGGADTITISPYTQALGGETNEARRIARNLHILLQDESYLSLVADPAAGARSFGTITNALVDEAWELFQSIEAKGGILALMKSGDIQKDIAAIWDEKQQRIAIRREPITGVSEFPNIHEKLPAVDAAEIITASPVLFADDFAGSTLAGKYQPSRKEKIVVDALPQHALDEDFEMLRARADIYIERTGSRPKVYLANIGPVSRHIVRSNFIKNFVETAGFEAVVGAGSADRQDIYKEATASGCQIAVVCGDDEMYETYLSSIVDELRDAYVSEIWVAGKFQDMGDIDGFIQLGSNVINIMSHFFDVVEKGEK